MGPTAKQQAFVHTETTEVIPPKPVLLPPAPPTPISVLHEAVQRGANVETLTRLFELQERWEAREAKKAFDAAFAAFKAEAPALERTKAVSYGQGKASYKYTPLDEVAAKLDPVLSKHGLSYSWAQTQLNGNISVTCILKHIQGHFETNTLEGPADTSGNKNPVQSISSGVSYLRRYTLLGVVGKATKDEDSDGFTMAEAADYLALISEASNLDDLVKNYKAAIADALKRQSPKSIALFMQARQKREKELSAA